jgi:hypothetical protein
MTTNPTQHTAKEKALILADLQYAANIIAQKNVVPCVVSALKKYPTPTRLLIIKAIDPLMSDLNKKAIASMSSFSTAQLYNYYIVCPEFWHLQQENLRMFTEKFKTTGVLST